MKVGDSIIAENANWSFSGDTVNEFDEHVSKSVPLYSSGHELICKISDFFIKGDSTVYEIGTSTGELLFNLEEHNKHKVNIDYIGLDLQQDMINKANRKKEKKKKSNSVN